MARVLVVDDDRLFRISMRRLLEEEDYEVVEAGDGQEALRVLDASIDLIVCDIIMPQMEGLETIRNIRARSGAVPIVAVSGGSPNLPVSFLDQAVTFGANAALSKPFSHAELLDTLARLVPGK